MTTDTHQLVNRYRIRADVEYGEHKPRENDGWEANGWHVTLHMGRKRISTDYFTGLGIKGQPEADDVLDSLLLDAACADEDFEDFCANLGYDNSRKAERTYKACVATERKLRQFLNGHYDEFMQADRL